mgnify:CR=1 FL=1
MCLKAGPSACREWQRAADIAGRRAVVKFTVPGPMTLMDGMVIMLIL